MADRQYHLWLATAHVFAREYGVEVTRELRAGPVVREVVKAAEKFRADLIVLGCRSHPPARYSPAPTLVRRIRHRAPCPVPAVD